MQKEFYIIPKLDAAPVSVFRSYDQDHGCGPWDVYTSVTRNYGGNGDGKGLKITYEICPDTILDATKLMEKAAYYLPPGFVYQANADSTLSVIRGAYETHDVFGNPVIAAGPGTTITLNRDTLVDSQFQLSIPTNQGPVMAELTTDQLENAIEESVLIRQTPPSTSAHGLPADTTEIQVQDSYGLNQYDVVKNLLGNSDSILPELFAIAVGIIIYLKRNKIGNYIWYMSAQIAHQLTKKHK